MSIKQAKSKRFLTIEDYRSLWYSRLFLIIHCFLVCFIVILQVFAFPFQIITNGTTLVLWIFYVHICLFIASQVVLFKTLRKGISSDVYTLLSAYAVTSLMSTIFCFWYMFRTIRMSTEEYVISLAGSTQIDVTQRIITLSILSFVLSLASSTAAIFSFVFYKYSYVEHSKFRHWLKYGTVRNNLLLMNRNDKHIFEYTDSSSSEDIPTEVPIIPLPQ